MDLGNYKLMLYCSVGGFLLLSYETSLRSDLIVIIRHLDCRSSSKINGCYWRKPSTPDFYSDYFDDLVHHHDSPSTPLSPEDASYFLTVARLRGISLVESIFSWFGWNNHGT